mgnify:CR=1 FL=1
MKKTLSMLWAAGLLVAACQSNNTGQDNAESTEATTQDETTGNKETKKGADPRLTKLWDSDTTLITNESVLPYNGKLYVSNIQGQPTDEDGKGSIAILNTDGSIEQAIWVEGLDAPKGMAVHEGALYVTDINELVVIAMDDPSDISRYPVEGAQFLNDVAAANNGVYFSDMKTGKLHHFSDESVTTVAEGLTGINGLAWSKEEGLLHLLTGKGLHKMNDDGSFPIINSTVTNGDGLVILGEESYIVSRWQGEIWHVEGEEATKLFDSTADKIQTADIGFDHESQTLYVPRFFSNKVTAMQFKK